MIERYKINLCKNDDNSEDGDELSMSKKKMKELYVSTENNRSCNRACHAFTRR